MTPSAAAATATADHHHRRTDRRAPPLAPDLASALAGDHDDALWALAGREPCHRHDEALALAAILDLHLAPLDRVGRAARWQHHPVVAGLKGALEDRFAARLAQAAARLPPSPADPVAALRALAAHDLVPPVYDRLAHQATLDELRRFVALEGGPDDGFDDLVALCQVGLGGEAKVELATNYWDELGRGRGGAVHRRLHERMAAALDLRPPARHQLPVAALERGLLCSMLATCRWRQPELVGALGLVELQAGPRCRRVVAGLRRLGAPAGALPFYEEHAVADPRHGRDWLDHVVRPLGADPATAAGIVRGARWRSAVNAAFYRWVGPAR